MDILKSEDPESAQAEFQHTHTQNLVLKRQGLIVHTFSNTALIILINQLLMVCVEKPVVKKYL